MHGMYVKITRSGKRQYLQLVEAVRENGKPRQRHVATLGRLDQLLDADVDALVNGLLKATGRAPLGAEHAAAKPDEDAFSPALALGDLWLLLGLWQQLGMAQALKRTLHRRRVRFDVEALVRVMVFNRLSDPTSKLGLLRWLETVYLPGIDRAQVSHQHLLRAMDVLCEHKEALEEAVGKLLLPLLDQDLSVVFYDLTTVRIHGEGEVEKDVRRFGHSKDVNGTARQFAVGVVQSAEGIPLAHEVFEGNVYEAATLEGMVQRLLARFPTLTRIVLVADRGLLNLDNLALLEALQTPAGTALEYTWRCRRAVTASMVSSARSSSSSADPTRTQKPAGNPFTRAGTARSGGWSLPMIPRRRSSSPGIAMRRSPRSKRWLPAWPSASTPKTPASPSAGDAAATRVPSPKCARRCRRPSSAASSTPTSTTDASST